ncbi:TrmH family RNA methyltransferase [Planctomicrobium sp. SH668]|uniref:TrmH family RNA methyltransferase n=1 Tax=Planctomicrobium sp. SH668 TaxID=3448126 RepID=UPI003F5B2BF1
MPEQFIEGIDDPRIVPYRHLRRMNLTRWSGLFIAEGTRLVERLLESDFEIHSILVSEAHRRRLSEQTLAEKQVYVAPLPILEQVIGFQFHAGMLACGYRKQSPALQDWLPPRGKSSLIVGCPQTSDPDNLGTVIRISAGLGADGVLVGKTSADPFSRRTLRISMGNAFFLPILQSGDFAESMRQMQVDGGYTAVASMLDPSAIPLSQVTRPHRLLLLLGNEDEGLPPDLAAMADEKVVIPMADQIDSLNVGIAAGIMLHHYEQVAQRRP